MPLIIRRPGEQGGRRIKGLTQSIDIFPTLFDMEGIEIPYNQFGVSLKPEVTGQREDMQRVVYAEGGYDTREAQCFETLGPPDSFKRKIMGPGTIYYPKMVHQEEQPESVCRAVMRRDQQYKVVFRTNGEHELYDMVEDPQEYHNLYGASGYEAVFNEKAMQTLTWMLHTSDIVPPPKPVKPWFELLEEKQKQQANK